MRYFHYFRVFQTLMKNKTNVKRSFSHLTTPRIMKRLNLPPRPNKTLNTGVYRQINSLNSDSDEEDGIEDYPLLETEQYGQQENVKYVLFKDSNDIIIKDLNNCSSIEGVWSVFKKHKMVYREEHLTQTIIVLNYLQNMYHSLKHSELSAPAIFLSDLQKYPEFSELLQMTKESLPHFDPSHLSFVLLYLHKLGISVETGFMQSMCKKIQDHLCENFDIHICSKLLRVLFTEKSVRPYHVAQQLIPVVFNFIDTCYSSDDLENLTICLNKLHNLVTNEILTRYTGLVEDFIKTKKLNSGNHQTILSVIKFLNYPEWRYKLSLLTSDCILLLKDEITSLDVPQLLTLYEVFFKNEEPGEVLNEIQRSAAKFWQNCEEDNTYHIDTSLKIFSALIYFSSPLQRIQFQKDIYKFMKNCNNFEHLLQLRNIFSYVKVSDDQLCESYWRSSLAVFKQHYNVSSAVKLCQNYMNFHTDIHNYRHTKFEKKALELIESTVLNENFLLPSELATFLAFTMVYGTSQHLIDKLLQRFEDNLTQIKALDCLKVSHSVGVIGCSHSIISRQQLKKIKALLEQRTKDIFHLGHTNFVQNALLIKGAIMRNDCDNSLMENLLLNYKELPYMSSKMIENLSFILLTTSSLIPEVVNKCTEYIVNHSPNVIGFNAEKMLFLCYYLAYYPINAEKFFQAVTDIIIRDKERLSSLAFLQSALSLSFFNRLPSFLVKQIFNVEFMDKLDNELANCYSKDKYSQRVRNTLMHLNRAVCLEYPEFNVPWFHEKYVQEIEKRYEKESDYDISIRIKEHLTQITGNTKYIIEHLVTPYGYHVDFVINLNEENKIVSPESVRISRKIALLLMKRHAYTRFYSHLKGKYQMKIQHLEILGYTVSILNVNEWINLLYPVERLEYLNTLIWPEKDETMR